ncbi:MAG: hypothetical protein DRO67_06950 [Candidatus Asgardarchaeum californiense]|nr:MAG: hypothetical protein DRO67_06950 [Candidatus Asgardarchaeum californiense]
MVEEENLTFEDGILICKHIYQCAIHKTLGGVMEEWEIFQKTHEMLNKLDQQKKQAMLDTLESQFDKKRLDELLFRFNIENIYATI